MMHRVALAVAGFALVAALGITLYFSAPARAADHGDAPSLAHDQGADLADCYFFLDPNDNSKAVLAMTVHGFIASGENANFGIFDPTLLYRFYIENTGDAKPDQTIDVEFTQRVSPAEAQRATIGFSKTKTIITANATNSTVAATPPDPVTNHDTATNVDFFAGLVDDPFFFDIPGVNRFIASIRAGSPDATQLNRGRDSFAGYNVLAIVLRVPLTLIKGSGNEIGMSCSSLRQMQTPTKFGVPKQRGLFRQVDREGVPAVNVVLVPFALKNRYNAATPEDDAAGSFAADIVANLQSLGTDQSHINTLASVAVTRGDYLRLDVSVANTGAEGGTNAGAGFPNGRRPADDVVDTLLTIIGNGTALSDHVDRNDLTFRNTFPFFAPPQQPRATGVTDDNTRN